MTPTCLELLPVDTTGESLPPCWGHGTGPEQCPARLVSSREKRTPFPESCLHFPPLVQRHPLFPQVQPGSLACFFSPCPCPFLERSDTILHRCASSKYLEVSPVLSPLSQMVGRVTSHVLASAQERGVCAQGGRSLQLLRGGRPHPRPVPNLPPIPGAQETSGAAPDGKRAGAWRKTRCRGGHCLSTEYILTS